MSNLLCTIYLNNSAWIMISIAMICAVPLAYIIGSFIMKGKKLKQSVKHYDKATTTVKKNEDETTVTDERDY